MPFEYNELIVKLILGTLDRRPVKNLKSLAGDRLWKVKLIEQDGKFWIRRKFGNVWQKACNVFSETYINKSFQVTINNHNVRDQHRYYGIVVVSSSILRIVLLYCLLSYWRELNISTHISTAVFTIQF